MKSVVCVIVWDNYSILWINYPEIPTNGSEAHSQLYIEPQNLGRITGIVQKFLTYLMFANLHFP